MTVHLVRHAYAGDRDAWTTQDDLRPLSARGHAQAGALAALLRPSQFALVASSPAVRCVQTVEPLALACGLRVNADAALAEGNAARAVELVHSLAHIDTVLCSHGDVIPEVLNALAGAGVRIEDEWRWEKASVWTFHAADGRFTHATYLPPPEV